MSQPYISSINVHIGARGNGEKERRIRTVGKNRKLEGDVLLEFNTDSIGFFYKGC